MGFIINKSIGSTVLSDLSVDSPTFVVDDVNNRVGHGTASPSAKTDVLVADTENMVALEVNQNDTTNNPVAVTVSNTGTGDNLVVNTNALVSKSDGTLGVGTATTSAKIDAVVANTANTKGLEVNQNDTTNNPNAVDVNNTGTGKGLFLNQDGNGVALDIDSEATTQSSINVNSVATSANVVRIVADSLTSQGIMRLTSNSADTSTRFLFSLVNDNTAAVNTIPVRLTQDAANEVLNLDQNAASSFINFEGTEGATTTDPVSTHPTAGTIQKWIQIEINGTKYWLPAYSDPSA